MVGNYDRITACDELSDCVGILIRTHNCVKRARKLKVSGEMGPAQVLVAVRAPIIALPV